MKLGARLIGSASEKLKSEFLQELGPDEVRALPYMFEFWALPHQLPPTDDWRTWVIMGGRGAGKTRAGAEWVRVQVEGGRPEDAGRVKTVALVGETYDQARDVMVFGDSGIIACSPPDRKPSWVASKRCLVWPNGAKAFVFSANDYEALRGPQFEAAWVDELAKWPKAKEAWDMLQFCLRLGDSPRQVVTTTPRNVPILKQILSAPSTVVSQASTYDNRANLAGSFLEEVQSTYAGTRLGQQELDGLLIEEIDGALWTPAILRTCEEKDFGQLDRIVVAVDPPVTGKATSDACGIVVAGARTKGSPRHWDAIVLEDATISAASPLEWAEAAVAALHRHNGDRLVAEVNQGGDLVEMMLRQVDPMIPFRGVHATRGKIARAEPIAALYEQGRVSHVRGLGTLEAQMGLMSVRGYSGPGSPDRVDALVWALTDLMLDPAASWKQPRVRTVG